MAKKRNKSVGTPWTVCRVVGYITASDPGILSTTTLRKEYRRGELLVGMNLCDHCEDLPEVVVKSVRTDHIVVAYEGSVRRLNTGGSLQTPRIGLSYAYSEAHIELK